MLITLALFTASVFPEPAPTAQDWSKVGLAALAVIAWGLCGVLSLRRNCKFWLAAAACPLMLLMLRGYIIPEQVIDRKQPHRFITQHLDELENSRLIVANTACLIPGVAWTTRRSDILMTGSYGELAYGLAYPDSQHRHIPEEDLNAWVAEQRQHGTVTLIMRLRVRIALLDKLTPPDKLLSAPPFYMLIYKQPELEDAAR
jgi:4-amino-4-deoxy-L-arabinose transferase